MSTIQTQDLCKITICIPDVWSDFYYVLCCAKCAIIHQSCSVLTNFKQFFFPCQTYQQNTVKLVSHTLSPTSISSATCSFRGPLIVAFVALLSPARYLLYGLAWLKKKKKKKKKKPRVPKAFSLGWPECKHNHLKKTKKKIEKDLWFSCLFFHNNNLTDQMWSYSGLTSSPSPTLGIFY